MKDDLRLVFWELTARCNLSCKHCRAEAQDHFVKGELTTAEILAVAADIRETGDPIMILTGGEPLVREDFFEIASACSELFSRVAIATNGTLVDDAMAHRIVDAGIQKASISVDGATAETHDVFRGLPGSYDTALAGMDALRRAGLPVQINATVTRQNVGELEAIMKLAMAHGADAFHVFVLVPVGCGVEIGDDLRLPADEMERVLRWLFDQSLALRGKLHIKATCAPQYYRIMHEVSRERGIKPAGHASPHGSGHGAGPGGSQGGATHGMHAMFHLTAEKSNMVYLPRGLAHGFLTLSDAATMMYKVATIYAPQHDAGILWNSVGITGN